MDILLAGGGCPLADALINKYSKSGHRVYVLTEKRFRSAENRKAFEYYYFPYDSDCIGDVLDSVDPDLIVALGAYDPCFDWTDARRESVRFLAGFTNLMLVYSMRRRGRFVYLSSEEVFTNTSADDITEQQPPDPNGARSMALSQAERLCVNYGEQAALDTVVARIDGLYDTPVNAEGAARHRCGRMCLEAIRTGTVSANSRERFSMIYLSDAVEHICRLSVCAEHKLPLYNISSSAELNGVEVAEIIAEQISGLEIVDNAVGSGHRIVLSGRAYDSEFGLDIFCPALKGAAQVAKYMGTHRSSYLSADDKGAGAFSRFTQGAGAFLRAAIPFLECLVFFIPFFMINNRTVGSGFFSEIDFLLLYVILFAIVHGQIQAAFAAMLATAGYIFRRMYDRTGFEVISDYNTYVWVAMVFIVGLAIGYLRDRLDVVRNESRQDIEHLHEQLEDIRDINSSNSRMKNLLINQLTNQEDSIGKIYGIVSALDKYSEEEVLFYAADVVARLMDCKDVAIYTVSNPEYARLYSSTSKNARKLGNSIKYMEMEELSKAIADDRVYINKALDSRYPLMTRAIYADGKPKLIIMLWGIPWERMTLTNADMLTVISFLLQNTTLKAERYLKAMEDKRYVSGTDIMEERAFSELVRVYLNARGKGLTECTLINIAAPEGGESEVAAALRKKIRPSDYIGTMSGRLYALLSNTSEEAAEPVLARFAENGFTCTAERDIEV